MTESTPVSIKVVSEIHNEKDHDIEKIEVDTTGEYIEKGRSIYLRYNEKHELGSVRTTVKISGDEVVVMRSGAVTMKQRFIQAIPTVTDYGTPFGKLQLQTFTHTLQFEKTELEDRLVILYDLQIDENEKHVHKLMISYKEDNK
ncbi:uncharacterized beta-barrel protein YwiB (DUF1934 family) [Metabacillus crassostreae]|uniref:DUF1934 domain-containing protein n=1 Tax=Metabacillus crassostreae TaxID=929098 RepID=UPI00195A25DE|nr:DUF1934 domain-containing protein [Metabacillus crassostreae]MBM7605271.1 uncharacterized beta-barrel protein YwiB (DUF1934 family) [Metabacillus crassostreae]